MWVLRVSCPASRNSFANDRRTSWPTGTLVFWQRVVRSIRGAQNSFAIFLIHNRLNDRGDATRTTAHSCWRRTETFLPSHTVVECGLKAMLASEAPSFSHCHG